MREIAQWLKKLGLEQYAERFAENGIDISVLRHLTDQDLKDIGVLLGHRRLQAVAVPGTVVIGPATRRLLAGLFEYQDLGPVDLKGFEAPVQAYQVVRP